ncbi:MAG: hypothetical protein U0P45_03635 [Acidimicrobiales bacterium]
MDAQARGRTTMARAALLAAALVLVGTGCSSGGSEAATTTERATTTRASTTAPATSEATTTTGADPTTTAADGDGGGLPPCEQLLEQYANTFDLDDLRPTSALFRTWAPDMPPKVGAAVLRIADAWDAVGGDSTKLDMADQAMTNDAEVFSDWTNAGCPSS